MPLIIVINEGTTTFKYGWDDKISIFTDRETKLDLSRKIEDSIVFPQTGTTRITGGSMSTKYFFGKNTAMVFKKIQYSQDQLIEGIIAALRTSLFSSFRAEIRGGMPNTFAIALNKTGIKPPLNAA